LLPSRTKARAIWSPMPPAPAVTSTPKSLTPKSMIVSLHSAASKKSGGQAPATFLDKLTADEAIVQNSHA
jgi:hypothetical protein